MDTFKVQLKGFRRREDDTSCSAHNQGCVFIDAGSMAVYNHGDGWQSIVETYQKDNDVATKLREFLRVRYAQGKPIDDIIVEFQPHEDVIMARVVSFVEFTPVREKADPALYLEIEGYGLF